MACSRLARRQTSSLPREPSIASDADSPSRKMKDFHVEDFDMIKTIGTGEPRQTYYYLEFSFHANDQKEAVLGRVLRCSF